VNKSISIFNDVLGPIMHGPSSSHTAGPYHIGRLTRMLLGESPVMAEFVFDPGGSFAEVYRQQCSDTGFVAGMLNWEITDERFSAALKHAPQAGLKVEFRIEPLQAADHPNTVVVRATGTSGRRLDIMAHSTGGGMVEIIRVQGYGVSITGSAFDLLIEIRSANSQKLVSLLEELINPLQQSAPQRIGDTTLLHYHLAQPLEPEKQYQLINTAGVFQIMQTTPVFFMVRGEPMFLNTAEMLAAADHAGCSLGEIALEYESRLLGLTHDTIIQEALRRHSIMVTSVRNGIKGQHAPMKLLGRSASKIFKAEAERRLPIGGLHARTAARALAVMHVNSGQGLVCAAPTAGSAGVLPAVVTTLVEEFDLSAQQTALALLAAAAIGLMIANRATFAAELAGCQVEIGASSAMAAAAVIEATDQGPHRAAHAASIALQNAMGLVCDPVQGLVEIPCHTRNAVAASAAFVCADLICGGYQNPVSLDETIDAMFAVGQMLPRELKCTSLGGLATTPSAQKLGPAKR
jgi:L-serine dehydratase